MSEKTIKMNNVEIKKVSSLYNNPFSALALCWYDKGKNGLFYDKVPASFARHPCDLFNKNGEREGWKYLNIKEESIEEKLKKAKSEEETSKILEHFKNILPEKAKYLWNNIAGGIQVSNFGRVGIPIKCKGTSGLYKGCEGCKLNLEKPEKVSMSIEDKNEDKKITKSVEKCTKFHFILPQYEKCFWNEKEQKFNTDYNGYLVVDNVITKENDNLVYHLVTEAFKMKESTLKYLEEENPNLITYINEIIDETVNKEALKKEAIEELNKAIETLRKGKTISLQIHHIDNNGHHNTPTYWDENETMIRGNLIALPDKVHNKL